LSINFTESEKETLESKYYGDSKDVFDMR